MSDDSLDSPLDLLAEEFARRYRRGERPSLTEFVEQHPEFETEIRELFPALVMMEKARSGDGLDRPTGTHAADFSSEPHGGRIGDFRVIREVGRGGMGIVYEAIQESLGRHVALKILPPGVEKNPRHLLRFQREARAAAKLHHPNIVPVFGVGESDGRHFYAMQFIHGLGLDEVADAVRRIRQNRARSMSDDAQPKDASGEVFAEALLSGNFPATEIQDAASGECEPLRERPLAASSSIDVSDSEIRLPGQSSTMSSADNRRAYWDSVARIGIQVSEALQYASDEGVLHRDIKPSNLLLDLKGTVWVADFGLAKSDESDALTNPGDILGTLRYMAPERFQGRSDLRSDIYSLGASLYEMIALRPMFDDTDRHRLMRQIVESEPVRLSKFDVGVPADLETVILKAISREPSDRYATAADFAEDLKRFVEDRPILARRVSRPEQVRKWCRRNPLVAGLSSVLLAMACVLGIGLWLNSFVRIERDHAVSSERRAKVAEIQARAAEQKAMDAEQRALDAEREATIRKHLAQANAYRHSGQLGQRFLCLEEVRLGAKLGPTEELTRELRNTAISAFGLTDLRPVGIRQEWRGCTNVDHRLERYARIELFGDKALTIRSTVDNSELQRFPRVEADFYYADLEFSPDDRHLVVLYLLYSGGSPLLHVWNLETRELVVSQAVRAGDHLAPAAFHPNGRWLVFPPEDGDLVVWDLTERREIRRLPLEFTPSVVCFDHSGDRIAVNNVSAHQLRILDFETGLQLEEFTGSVGVVSMSWSSDDLLLATGNSDGQVFVWHVPERKLVSILDGHSGAVVRSAFAHQGYLLATHSWDSTSRMWNAATGECLVTVNGAAFCFSPDDRHTVVMADLTFQLHEIAHGQEVRELHPSAAGNRTDNPAQLAINHGSFHPDGQILGTGSMDGARFWDLSTGRELAWLPIGACQRVLFHPTGDAVLTLSDAGIFRWPLSKSSSDFDVMQCGPPRKLGIDLSSMTPRDGQWFTGHQHVVVNDYNNGRIVIIDAENPHGASPPREFSSSHRRVVNISVSPDGQWIAAGGHKERAIQVWNVATGERHTVPHSDSLTDTLFSVSFSPDNRWLVSAAVGEPAHTGYYFYEVGTWKQHRFVKSFQSVAAPEFDTRGRIAALVSGPHEVLLADGSTGHQLARIEMNGLWNIPVDFSSDDSKLAIRRDWKSIMVLDLARMGSHLAELGLDWSLSHSGSKGDHSSKPVEFQVDLGDLPHELERLSRQSKAAAHASGGQAHSTAGRFEEAKTEFEQAIELDPTNPTTLNNYAWMLVTCPDLALRDPPRGLELARRCVAQAPTTSTYLNTLGVAEYRVGEWQAAIETLQKAEATLPDVDFGYNALVIAMAHWQLGRHDEARNWFQQAIDWQEKKNVTADELLRFRTEAEELMQ